MARATQLQRGSATSRNYSRGRLLARNNDDEYAHDLRHTMEDSRRTLREENQGQPTSRTGPSRSGPPSSSSQPHTAGPPPPNTAQRRRREPPETTPPPPPTELTVLTKTNGWPQSNGIRPAQLSCLLIPEEAATYPAPKMAVVAVANPLKYPELATSYSHLWAGFANGITIPEHSYAFLASSDAQ